jgi:predicted CXXCH cytochrome family protein
MKKVIVVVIMLMSLSVYADIAGTKHNFSSQTWSGAGGQICKPCHTPHNSLTTVSDAPLWNHTLTTATFTLYSSSTLNATMGQPNNQSKLCLSCHDGTVALDSFGGTAGGTFMAGSANLGVDLSNDHPVSFVYNSALATADGELYDPASTPSVNALLYSGRMECSSCHDPHGKTGVSKLLRVSNSGSALCLTCHRK